MSIYCSKVKQLRLVQKAFLENVGMETWDDAVRKLSSFASTEALDEFTSNKKFSSTDR